ncbi:hypothetical protein HID58_034991 [Brassica napus]|uniref:Uncharacterized protein n=1 Tax=Brassica napus TaxID=3708 RepID=A0ABQ8C3M6_BRANA|nr:hypothetical protein HID58_034991 [Brassica napus]
MRADEQIRELRYGQDNATATRSDFRCGEDDWTANRFEIRYGEDATTSRSHLRCGKDDDKLSCLLCFVIMFSDECVFAVRWSWLSFMSKHMKEKKRMASDNEEQNFLVKGEICLDFTCWNIFRLSLKQSLSLTSFYQFVKVSFKGVESGTGSLNFV